MLDLEESLKKAQAQLKNKNKAISKLENALYEKQQKIEHLEKKNDELQKTVIEHFQSLYG